MSLSIGNLIIKQNCTQEIHNILREQNVSGSIMYITDSYLNDTLSNRIEPQLDEVGNVIKKIVESNTINSSIKLAEFAITNDVDYMVGFGGGKVLDVSKYAAYISKRPMISIPTTLANDGVSSPIAVLKTDLGVPKSLGSAIPSAIILDTTLILDSPKQLIKAGIGDTISNYMALIDWEHASSIGEDEMNGFAYLMSKNALNALVKTQYDSICLEFVEVLANSIVMSGIAMYFAGSSRPVSGSEHLFSHALDYYCIQENLHGIQLALGTVSILKMLGYDYSKVLHYLNKFQVDINPVHLGISESDFILCMKKAPSMRHNRYTYLNEIDLSDKKLGRIYNELKEEL